MITEKRVANIQAAHVMKTCVSVASCLQNSTSLFKINTNGSGEAQSFWSNGYKQALLRVKLKKDRLSEILAKQKELSLKLEGLNEQIRNLVSFEKEHGQLIETLKQKEEEVEKWGSVVETLTEKQPAGSLVRHQSQGFPNKALHAGG
jgi:DNA repair exonuclease SbcCD ATPase subunit